MKETYQERVAFVMGYYKQDWKRLMDFYNRVYLALSSLPPCQRTVIDGKVCYNPAFCISKKVKAESLTLFYAVAEIIIVDERRRKGMAGDYLEISEDRDYIYRVPAIVPHRAVKRQVWGKDYKAPPSSE